MHKYTTDDLITLGAQLSELTPAEAKEIADSWGDFDDYRVSSLVYFTKKVALLASDYDKLKDWPGLTQTIKNYLASGLPRTL